MNLLLIILGKYEYQKLLCSFNMPFLNIQYKKILQLIQFFAHYKISQSNIFKHKTVLTKPFVSPSVKKGEKIPCHEILAIMRANCVKFQEKSSSKNNLACYKKKMFERNPQHSLWNRFRYNSKLCSV